MARTLISGVLVAVLVAVVTLTGAAIGITSVWPVLLAAAVGLALAPVTIGRLAALVVGAVLGWVFFAIRAGFLPDVPAARALTVVGGVLVLTAIAAVTLDRAPLWAGLAGYAVFTGLYEPLHAARPTAFLTESPLALLTVLLAIAIGYAIAAVAELFGGAARPEYTDSVPAVVNVDGEVA